MLVVELKVDTEGLLYKAAMDLREQGWKRSEPVIHEMYTDDSGGRVHKWKVKMQVWPIPSGLPPCPNDRKEG